MLLNLPASALKSGEHGATREAWTAKVFRPVKHSPTDLEINMDNELERKAFEEWREKRSGAYSSQSLAWEAWQVRASLAKLCEPTQSDREWAFEFIQRLLGRGGGMLQTDDRLTGYPSEVAVDRLAKKLSEARSGQ